jgi:putative ABC transport system permease protein
MALRSINRHRLRSLLTALGVIIGVWSVVSVVTLGTATTRAVTASISALGSNTLILLPGRDQRGGGSPAPRFRNEDAAAIADGVPGVRLAVPVATTRQTLVHDAANWRSTVHGVTVDYLSAQNWSVAEGRPFTQEEEQAGRAVCLVGDLVRRRLLADGPVEGVVLRVGGVACWVIGALAAKGQGLTGATDDTVLMPLKAVQRQLTGTRRLDSILVIYDPREDPARMRAQVLDLVRDRRSLGPDEEDDFTVFDTRQLTDTVTGTTRMLTGLLTAVGAVSLLVGGIGIMNIMLVSVTERTREIGLRLAIGAEAGDVLGQFLVEAVVLSCIGGLIGLLLANVTSLLISPLIGVGFAFSPGVNLAAVAVAAAVGIVFGYVPARRAAALSPIEALRRE